MPLVYLLVLVHYAHISLSHMYAVHMQSQQPTLISVQAFPTTCGVLLYMNNVLTYTLLIQVWDKANEPHTILCKEVVQSPIKTCRM